MLLEVLDIALNPVVFRSEFELVLAFGPGEEAALNIGIFGVGRTATAAGAGIRADTEIAIKLRGDRERVRDAEELTTVSVEGRGAILRFPVVAEAEVQQQGRGESMVIAQASKRETVVSDAAAIGRDGREEDAAVICGVVSRAIGEEAMNTIAVVHVEVDPSAPTILCGIVDSGLHKVIGQVVLIGCGKIFDVVRSAR